MANRVVSTSCRYSNDIKRNPDRANDNFRRQNFFKRRLFPSICNRLLPFLDELVAAASVGLLRARAGK